MPVLLQISMCSALHAPSLIISHRQDPVSQAALTPALDFNEAEDFSILRDDVNFAVRRPVTAKQDAQSHLTQIRASLRFPFKAALIAFHS